MKSAKWDFYCIDNGGKKQFFTVSAPTKTDAIEKAFRKAQKAARGDIGAWECKLRIAF